MEKKIGDVLKSGAVSIQHTRTGIVLTKSAIQTRESVEDYQDPLWNAGSQTRPSIVILDIQMSSKWNYFEIKILNEGNFREIGIGVGPADYCLTAMPGWCPGSMGYHADDGKLFQGSGAGRDFGSACACGDTMGCGVDFSSQKHGCVTVWFTRNGELAGPPEKFQIPKNGVYSLIGSSSLNESVSYIGHSCVQPPYKALPPTTSSGPDKCMFLKSTQAKVVYPYEAQLSDELTLKPGDMVETDDLGFQSKSNTKWAKGRKNFHGEKGLFFREFVQPIFTEETDGGSLGHDKGMYKGREYVLKQKPEEWLECVVCKELAHDPHQTSCCGHTLCLQCATKWKEKSNTCVNCRKEPFEFLKDPRAERLIMGLNATCPNSRHGCDWVGSLGRVQSHLETACTFGYLCKRFAPDTEVDCPCCACTVVDSRTQKKLFCGRMKYSEIALSGPDPLQPAHFKVCPEWPMRCPNKCSDTLTRSSLPIHLQEDCPNQILACDFSSMGCPVRGKRSELLKHMKGDLMEHLALLLQQHKLLSAELEKTKEDNIQLRVQQEVFTSELTLVKEENAKLEQKVAELASKKRKFF